MTRRHPLTVLTATIALGVASAAVLTACSGTDDAKPSASATSTPSATPTPELTAGPSPTPETPGDDQTGSADDGTGAGTGNGSGVETPSDVDFAAIGKQGVAAAGGGTVVSLAGSGDNWTVVVAASDGSLTQSVVSATLGRVTSGPFPKDSDDATKRANAARASALRVDGPAAATKATQAVSGTVSSVTLGGSGSAPTWTVVLSSSGTNRTVTVNGITGATS